MYKWFILVQRDNKWMFEITKAIIIIIIINNQCFPFLLDSQVIKRKLKYFKY